MFPDEVVDEKSSGSVVSPELLLPPLLFPPLLLLLPLLFPLFSEPVPSDPPSDEHDIAKAENIRTVSYTHLTLPTILRV